MLTNASAIGFILVILGQTELFTAHTSLGILPVLNGQATLSDLGRLWAVIHVMNPVGCALFAGFIAFVGPRLTAVDPAAFGSLASALLPYSAPTTLASGIVAGWLMGLLTWLVAAARDTTGEFPITRILASTIGFVHFITPCWARRRSSRRRSWGSEERDGDDPSERHGRERRRESREREFGPESRRQTEAEHDRKDDESGDDGRADVVDGYREDDSRRSVSSST